MDGDLDFTLRVSLDPPPADCDAASIRRVLDGIVDHMIKDLVEQVFICTKDRQVCQPGCC